MAVCGQCGRESPEEFGFCPACGSVLGAATARRESRKVVTVLFCDLTESTSLGERTDPETLRALMRRYYEMARTVLERHGGTVEKFVGDAVMAVFGVPVATEHDALRAVRAAVELRDTVHSLSLQARVGINTGDVVGGEGDTYVSGDAVNVAARLEQSAGNGEILLGDHTLSLVRDAVVTEPVQLKLKGKSAPVTAHRLLELDVKAAGVARRLERTMIGREREAERLRSEFSDAVAGGCRLFTLIGPAGVGKSRLVADFLDHVGHSATIASGRALSYGEGITYWPLIEMLIQLGVEPDMAIRSSPADTQLATRGIFEQAAAERPLVLVIDDLHWGEPALLDVIEHVVDWSRDSPIFVLCIGRPELLDTRPGWGGGKMNATAILLEPLADAAASALADELLGGLELDADTRARILSNAEGNPLFLEEMAALAGETDGLIEVPPTIRALLQARLDTLNDTERTVIDRGAVEGKLFHSSAVVALSDSALRDKVPTQLLSLVRKELVRRDQSPISSDDAFRFRHLLIRDTAYDALPKAVRADLHERLADWLDGGETFLEQDEIIGYHLESAALYLRELEVDDLHAADLAARAAGRLDVAGSTAYERGDLDATRTLLTRAVDLLPPGTSRRRLIPQLVEALLEGSSPFDVKPLLEELDHGDPVDQASATALRVLADPAGGASSLAAAEADLNTAHDALVATGDDVSIARCERAQGLLAFVACRSADAYQAFRLAYDRLQVLDRPGLLREVLDLLIVSAAASGATADEQVRLLDEIDSHLGPEPGPLLKSNLAAIRARIEYLSGRIDYEELRMRLEHHQKLLEQTGARNMVGDFISFAQWIEGDFAAQEETLTKQVDELERLGDVLYIAQEIGQLAITLSRRDETDEALVLIARGRLLAREDDVADQIQLDLAEAHARSARGEHSLARELIGSARRRGSTIESAIMQDTIELVDAEVHLAAGETAKAAAIANSAADAVDNRGLPRYAAALLRQFLDLT